MQNIFDLLFYLCQELERRQIAYMISGSLAMSFYARPRMTRDIDMVILLNPKDIDDFIRIFEHNFYYHRPSIEEEVKKRGMFNVIHHQTGYKVDFIVRKDDEFRKVEFERRNRAKMIGMEAWVVSLEDLILSKFIWIQDYQFAQQMDDIKNLLDSESLDKQYLIYWIEKLNLLTFNLLTFND